MRPSRLPLAAAGLALALAAGPAPAQPPFTLELVLAFPYALDPVAAARADRVAWVVNEAGVRNVWTAAGPGFEAARLTAHAEDDGIALGGLRLTPDGTVLVYVRGGGPNRAGEHPNPTSHPDGAEQTIWAVPTGGGEPRKLAEGAGAEISPDGTRLVFARQGRVFEVSLRGPEEAAEPAGSDSEAQGANQEPADSDAVVDGGEGDGGGGGGEAPKPRELFQARGGLGGLRWSPDGRGIAFVSDRDDHVFVGVYDFEADSIRWLAPSVDRDGFPAWSPDGLRVAFLRVPGRRTGEKFDLTSATRFAVWVADAATGEGRELWRSPEEAGGFAQYYPEDVLVWAGAGAAAGEGRILFTSEHSGWLHVYALAPDGGAEPVDLTPGECEAETTAVTPDGSTLVFTSNCGDIDRRHLWRVPTAGGTPAPLTAGGGIETDPVVLGGGGHVAFRQATARRPQRLVVARLDGSQPRPLGPELPYDYPLDAVVEPQAVTFRASDGLEIHGQLFLPRSPGGGSEDKRRPAAIFLHGGPIRQMLLGFHYSDYYARAYAMNQYLASRGTVVLAVNFRSGSGYGRGFRRAEGQGPRGATEYRDVVAAGRYLRRLPEVDPERIGLWGGSYGGYLTALGLARDSELFAAGVDLHGVHDWSLRARELLPGGAWGITEEMMDTAYSSSPVADLTTWSSPILLVHGDDDRNVLFAQTTDLVQRL
ncbi:MAG TPA: prolyl oligopeptidase family serine peptidase, partial [Thermoanaerobaculia bacterium]|nr:prolyl oligopeptidase family serine peptidase [Thermoanaerobaculia bacterium]